MYCNLNAGQTHGERSTWHDKSGVTFPKTELLTFQGIWLLLNEYHYNVFVQYTESASIKRANYNQMSKKEKKQEKKNHLDKSLPPQRARILLIPHRAALL